MAKSTSTTRSNGSKSAALRSKVGPVALVLAAKAATLVAFILAALVIIMFSTVRVIPLSVGFVKSVMGVSMDMPVETVIAAWIAPSIFVLAIVFTVVLIALRALWKLRRRGIEVVSGWALGRENPTKPVDISSAPSKQTTKRDQRAAKTA